MTGRPTLKTDKVIDRICRLIATGKSLRQISKLEGMPRRSAVLDWLNNDPAFRARYAGAREDQAEHLHDGMAAIELGVLRGTVDPKAASVVLGNQRWRMEKLKPKVFGARLTLDHGVQDTLAEEIQAARERATTAITRD